MFSRIPSQVLCNALTKSFEIRNCVGEYPTMILKGTKLLRPGR